MRGRKQRARPAPAGSAPASAEVEDGRRRRSRRSREKVLEAIAEAIRQPDFEPSPERVAAKAGVSMSTVRRHFGDLEGLSRAMGAQLATAVQPHLEAGPFSGTRRARVRELVRRRREIFELATPFFQLARRQPRWPGDRRAMEGFEATLRAQIPAALGPLDEDRIAVLAALLSQPTWEHLRAVQGLDPDRAATLLEASALTLLAARSARR